MIFWNFSKNPSGLVWFPIPKGKAIVNLFPTQKKYSADTELVKAGTFLLIKIVVTLNYLNCVNFIPIVWHEPSPSGVFNQIV